MASKSQRRRSEIAKQFSESAARFYPEHTAKFLCPTCLSWSPLENTTAITEAHIIPDAAGGKLVTLLCQPCNSGFGSGRDRWFGEYIRLLRKQDAAPLHIESQRGFFEIDGVRMGGTVAVSEGGAMELLVHEWRTSPQALRVLASIKGRPRALFQRPGDVVRQTVRVTLPSPLLAEHMDSVALGFLTAAYLLWFRALGYSWALQKHLDVVRQQIRAESLTVLPRAFSGVVPERAKTPWIGFGTVNGELALLAGIEERVVLFPPADRPNFYEQLPASSLEGAKMEVLGRVDFGPNHAFAGPRAVLMGKRLVVCPDVFLKGAHPLILVPEGEGPIQVVHPASADQVEKLKAEYPDRGLSLSVDVTIPTIDTGR